MAGRDYHPSPSGYSYGFALHFVAAVDIDELRLVALSLFFRVLRVAADDDQITGTGLVGSGAIEGDLACALFSFDEVGGEPLPVGDVVDLDPFERHEISGPRQNRVDADGALVFEVGVGHRGTVDFGLEQTCDSSVDLQWDVVDQSCVPVRPRLA